MIYQTGLWKIRVMTESGSTRDAYVAQVWVYSGGRMEYDPNGSNDTQGGANHVHSVWHNPTNSFGEDLLKEHCASHHK